MKRFLNTIVSFLLGGLIMGSGYYGVVGTAVGATQDVNLLSIGPTGAGTAVDQGNGAVSNGTQRVTIANNSTGVINQGGTWSMRLQDGAGTSITSTTQALDVNVKNANANGQNTMANSSPVVIASNQSTVPVTFGAVASTGTLTHQIPTAASTNQQVVKASAGTVYMIRGVNTTASLLYIRMFDAATTPTCSGTAKEVIPVPASTTGAGLVAPQALGQDYTTGIAYCVTADAAGSSNGTTGLYFTLLYK